jgi:hypothetical protein
MINYSGLPVNDGLKTAVDTEFKTDPDNSHIELLWSKVCLNDLDSLEIIHSLLYPLLFKYVYFITKDTAAADEIIGDAFIHFWHSRCEVRGKMLKADIVKYIRQAVTSYLNPSTGTGKVKAEEKPDKIEHPVILLSGYNSLGFNDIERIFLSEYLKLNCATITEILGN